MSLNITNKPRSLRNSFSKRSANNNNNNKNDNYNGMNGINSDGNNDDNGENSGSDCINDVGNSADSGKSKSDSQGTGNRGGGSKTAQQGRAKPKRQSRGRVFQCTGYPDCNMSFTRSEHLARHKRKHTGERPFTCPHCSKNFSRLDNLRQHKQTVHAYENYVMNNGSKNEQQEHIIVKNPATPSNPLFNINSTNNDTHASLISPPYSRSPHFQYPFQYHLQQHLPPPQYNEPSTMQAAPAPQQSNLLKVSNHQFNPKRRPRPLSLSYSFLNGANPNNGASAQAISNGYMKSAPLVSLSQPSSLSPAPASSASLASSLAKTLVSDPSKSASSTPKIISPLSPLFHQSFSQINRKNNNHSHIKNTNDDHIKSPCSSIQFSKSLNNTLPSVQNLPRPTSLNPIDNESRQRQQPEASLKNILNNQSSSLASIQPIKKETTKNWLKGVLNVDNKKNEDKQENLGTLQSQKQDSDKVKDNQKDNNVIYNSKKPTINSLLLPCDDI